MDPRNNALSQIMLQWSMQSEHLDVVWHLKVDLRSQMMW